MHNTHIAPAPAISPARRRDARRVARAAISGSATPSATSTPAAETVRPDSAIRSSGFASAARRVITPDASIRTPRASSMNASSSTRGSVCADARGKNASSDALRSAMTAIAEATLSAHAAATTKSAARAGLHPIDSSASNSPRRSARRITRNVTAAPHNRNERERPRDARSPRDGSFVRRAADQACDDEEQHAERARPTRYAKIPRGHFANLPVCERV